MPTRARTSPHLPDSSERLNDLTVRVRSLLANSAATGFINRIKAKSTLRDVMDDRIEACFPALEAEPSRYRSAMRWIALVLLPVLACGAFASAASARMSTAPSCVTAEVRVHDEAVFGHFATRAGASALKARAARQGFAGIKIEAEGCGDFEVEIDGADTQSQRSSFAKEALKAGYPVTFEQTAPPLQYRPGEVYGIFATKRTVADANGVMTKLSRNGFLFVDLARQGNSWLVVMPQVPVKAALPIAREAAAAGFHIQFHSGTK